MEFRKGVYAIIIVPTLELASQVYKHIRLLVSQVRDECKTFLLGDLTQRQSKSNVAVMKPTKLVEQPHIVVGTPEQFAKSFRNNVSLVCLSEND